MTIQEFSAADARIPHRKANAVPPCGRASSVRPSPGIRRTPRLPGVAGLAFAALLLAGCGGPEPAPGAGAAAGAGATPAAEGAAPAASEVQAPSPRLVMTHSDGIMVLDAKTLELVGEAGLAGFNRLSRAGDGRHVLVSTGSSFRVFDAGAWTERHGDHGHSYAARPSLTDLGFEANKSGHVVSHAGRTALFSDGSGQVEIFDPSRLAAETGRLPETETYTAPAAHHGVGVPLEDGKLLVSLGNEEGRTGIAVLDAGTAQGRMELMRNEDCPGVHGEAVAGGKAVVVGCENGMLVYRGGQIAKVSSPDAYGRMGNQAGSPESPVILGDYKVDRGAVLERPTRVSLVNTDTGGVRLVELGTSYSFRSLGRGPAGEALVLGTDGALRVIDPLTGAITASIPVVEPWEESETWQDPRPALFIQGSTAYATDPATSKIHAVSLGSGTVLQSAALPHVPNELTGVDG